MYRQVYLKEFACLLLCLFRSALNGKCSSALFTHMTFGFIMDVASVAFKVGLGEKNPFTAEYGPDFLCRDSCCRSVDVLEKTFPQNLHTPGIHT